MRMPHRICLCLCLLFGPALLPARAAPEEVRLFAAPELVAAGLMAYVLPRFRLKTQVPVALVESPEGAEVIFATGAPEGVAGLVEGPGGAYAAWARGEASPSAKRFLKWLGSEIGLRTLTAYRQDGAPLLRAVKPEEEAADAALPEGDLAAGKALAYRNCGRCHVVGAENRMQGVGSTPSFAVLRALGDWQARFATYYQRRPHPSFTQIEGLTEPFAATAPPPIVPLRLSVEDFNNIIAFVARIAPADLGAPLQMR